MTKPTRQGLYWADTDYAPNLLVRVIVRDDGIALAPVPIPPEGNWEVGDLKFKERVVTTDVIEQVWQAIQPYLNDPTIRAAAEALRDARKIK